MRTRAPQNSSAVRAAAVLWSGWLAWAAPLPAAAQPSEPPLHDLAAPAAVASAPTAPLAYVPPAALLPTPTTPGTPSAPQTWRAANSAVAEFPRGHADILAWEQSHTGHPAAPAPQTAAPGPAGHHAGHHPPPHPSAHPPGGAHRPMAPGARP